MNKFFIILFLTLSLGAVLTAESVLACNYHAYRLCVNNTNIYWFDSCGNQQDLYQVCNSGLVCNTQSQYGQCATAQYNPVVTPINPTYEPYYSKACYNNSIYWHDSLGAISGLYKSCNDNNACTQDTCYNAKCVNTQIVNCPAKENNQNNNQENKTQEIQPSTNTTNLSMSFLAKLDSNSAQWQKTIQAGSDTTIYFTISVNNNSATQADNVSISVNIPTQISTLGNLKLDNVAISGDVVSGVNLGSVIAGASKTLTFEGKTGTISQNSATQAVSTINVSGRSQTDYVSISFSPNQQNDAGASVSSSNKTSGFGAFIKRWYMWIIVGLVLIFLFVVIFKRLSSET